MKKSVATLSILFLAGTSHAQVQESVEAPSEVLATKPVSVSEGMAPAPVPAALSSGNSSETVAQNSAPAEQATQSASAIENSPTQAPVETPSYEARTKDIKKNRYQKESDNEGRLIEKLEQARLEDEAKRAQEIEKFKATQEAQAKVETAAPAPVAPAPVAAAPTTTVIAPVIITEMEEKDYDDDSTSSFKISPAIGYRWTSGSYALKVRNRFVTGIALEGAFNEYLSIEGSFMFSQDEFRSKGGTVVASAYGPYSYPGGYNYFIRTRNTFSVNGGGKAGMSFGRFRPFVAGGIGGRFSKYNIDDAYTKAVAQAAGWQRSTNSIVALAGAGLDFSVMKNFGVGTRFDYEMVLNKKKNAMQSIYGDSANSYRILLNAQVLF